MVEEQVPPPEEPAKPEAPPPAGAVAAAPAEAAVAEPAAPEAQPAELSPAETAARLAALFPALFGPPPFKPIKLRIQADIQQRAPGQFSKKTLSLFLHRHTTSTAYLKGMAAHAERFDLDGQPAGELAPDHKAAAEAELARRREIVEAKKAAAREQHREQRREQFREQQRQQQAQRQAAHQAARQAEDAEFAARRERAQLLRAFETSTLTRANFCALKRISETELEAQLERARAERQERPPQPPREARFEGRRDGPPRGPRPGQGPGPRPGPNAGPQDRPHGLRPPRTGGAKPPSDKPA